MHHRMSALELPHFEYRSAVWPRFDIRRPVSISSLNELIAFFLRLNAQSFPMESYELKIALCIALGPVQRLLGSIEANLRHHVSIDRCACNRLAILVDDLAVEIQRPAVGQINYGL